MTGHSHVWRRRRGFTMVELIVVIVLVGILGAIGVARFFDRAGFDADAFTEQTRAMLRFAQKLAVAQNRPVFVRLDGDAVALCFTPAAPCPPASQVAAPAGANSGSAATRQYCQSDAWDCEGRPLTVSWSLAPATAFISFDALGRPHDASGADDFPGLAINLVADGAIRSISIAPETGYVY